MRRFLRLVAVVPFVLASACIDSSKAPAEAALKAADDALVAVGPEASTYAPEAVAAVKKSYATAKELIGTKEYEGALKAASGIPAKVQELNAVVAARKAEIGKAWTDVSASVSATVSSIKGRLATLAKAKRLPAGVDKTVIVKATEEVANVESGLAKLAEDAKGAKIAEAVAGAKALQAKGEEILRSLGSQ
ncbi:MAG: hypothetical protein H6Q88_3402 [Anaeromyxobacteraceae bacterium]|nr:hypothetical protein [Anaeromyxobacteraceae bacterium]